MIGPRGSRRAPGRRTRPCLAIVAAAGLVTVLAGCADDATGGAASHDDEGAGKPTIACGASTYDDGHQVIRYCGEGSAVVRISGAAAPVEAGGAVCSAHGAFVTANFGTNYSNPKAAEGSYVGFLIGDVGGRDRAAPPTITQIDLTVDGERIPISKATATATLADAGLDATVKGSTPEGVVTITATCPVE